MTTLMKRKLLLLLMALAMPLVLATPMWAQSSGNFSASVNTAKCVLDNSDGTITGGIGATFLETTIKTPNSNQTALLIRPSLVTGLYTKNKVTDQVDTATVWAGVRVRVCLDGKVVAPGTPVGATCDAGDNDGWIFYNKRWVQVSQDFLNQIDACNVLPEAEECFLQLTISTLSAHSFDFVAGNVGGGTHTVKVEWVFEDSDTNSTANAAACVGPGVVTVTQVKTFSTGGGIVIE